MKPTDIDYQVKIITPTQQLYQKLNVQAGDLFEQAKESALELHTKVAQAGLEFYNHPTETAARWQAEASEKGSELYARFNNDMLPALKSDYQLLISNTKDYSTQAQEALQFFIDNPEKVTVEAFTAFNQALMAFINKTMNVSELLLDEITNQVNEIISLLIAQPMQTMEDIYYDSLTALLNGYFQLVSSLLTSV